MTIKGSKLALLLLLVVALEILLFEGSDAKRWPFPFKFRRRSTPSRPSPRPSPSPVNNGRPALNTMCPTGSSISLCQSQYNGGRTYYFKCKKGPCDYKIKHCSTSLVYYKSFKFRCRRNHFIAGVGITYNAWKRDPRFSFRCCHKNGYTCTGKTHLIRLYAPMSFEVPNGFYLVGVSIEHSNQGETWQFETCAFKKAANMDESLRTANSNLRYKLAEERE